jgi:hypothetical protein
MVFTETLVKDWLFSKTNMHLFGLCAFLLVVGYVLLAQGPAPVAEADNYLSSGVAPAILVIVYCGLIPYAILHGYGKNDGKEVKK